MRPTLRQVGPLLATLATLACQGSISGGNDDQPAPGFGDTAGPETPGTDPAASTCGNEPVAAIAPLRRLSREQYDNTVRDLLAGPVSVTSDFEVDERIGGYESNAVIPVSPTSVARYRDAAEVLAANAVAHLSTLLPCDPVTMGEEPCARAFIDGFGRRAYRRPLTTTEVAALLGLYSSRRAGSDFSAALGLVISAILQSPHFLYRVELAEGAAPGSVVPLNGPELATRLAYFYWQSTPDEALLSVALGGELDTATGVEMHAKRLAADSRAAAGARSFVRQWLGFDSLLTLDKNTERFPDFTDEVRRSMLEESLRFADSVFRGPERTLAALFGGAFTFVDAPLATFYGLTPPAEPFGRVDLTGQNRGGLLSLGAFLTVTSHPSEASPILRGKLIRQNLLCEQLQPPPPGLDIRPPPRDPNVSTKEWLAQHRAEPACSGCHQLMDPIGFIFQHYDAVGRYTELDGNLPVDASGEVITGGDAAGSFNGVAELSHAFAQSSQVRACLADQLVRYAIGRPGAEEDACSIAHARSKLESDGLDLSALLLGIVTSDAFRFRKVEP